MGACTSKTKKNKEKHLKNDATNGSNNKDPTGEHVQQQSSSVNVDKFDNVPFIDSEEKLNTTNSPPLSGEQSIPTNHNNDNDERTTVKTNFETNVSYSSAETIDKLKQEVYTFLREKIFPIKEEKQKLIDYVHKRIIGNSNDTAIIDETLEQCFNDIEKHQHPDNDINNKIKRRLMNIVTIYVSSQSPDNSFLKALYDKMGPSLDLNSLNAETNEHEVVNVTVTKTVRQVFIDGSSSLIPNPNFNSTNEQPNSVIHISNNEHNIPADLPDDIRQQGQSYVSDKQTTLEDRYYNNQSFQNEYPVNNSDVNTAATKIQAQFRGYKARRDFEKMKQESKQSIDFSDKQESDYDYSHDEYQKLSFDKQNFEELMEEERREKERAAIAIQAQFRGFQVRKHLRESLGNIYEHPQQQEFDYNYDKIPSTHFNDHHDLDKIEGGKNDDINRPHFKRESTELSDDFERHTQIPRDSNFAREQKPEFFNEDDMSDSTLDKAATRIQASYRGYKTRKELGSVGNHSNIGHDQHHSSSQIHDEYNNTRNKNILSPSVEGNKVPANESDAAAVKIQAAYRGYRVRKDLEK